MPSVKPAFPRLRRDGHWSVRGLVAHWPFYEGAGEIVHDIADHHDGTMISMDSAVAWAASERGRVIDFTDAKVQYDRIDSATFSYSFPYGVSMGIWFNATYPRTGSYFDYGFVEYREGPGGEGIAIWADDSANNIALTVKLADASTATVHVSTAWDTYEWHHVFGTWDTETLSIYFDGRLEESAGISGTCAPDAANDARVRIGNDKPAYSEGKFRGMLDVPTLYSRALSAAEVPWLAAFADIIYEPPAMPWLGPGAAAGVTVTPSVPAITASMPGEVATGGALIAASVADVLSEAIAAQALGAAQISASVADMASSLPAGAATGGAKIAPSVLSLLAELPSETIITGAVVAVDPATAMITVLAVIFPGGEVEPPLHLSNLQRQSVHVVDLRRQQVHVGDLRRESIHADLD